MYFNNLKGRRGGRAGRAGGPEERGQGYPFPILVGSGDPAIIWLGVLTEHLLLLLASSPSPRSPVTRLSLVGLGASQ